jgi:hypothetical protein
VRYLCRQLDGHALPASNGAAGTGTGVSDDCQRHDHPVRQLWTTAWNKKAAGAAHDSAGFEFWTQRRALGSSLQGHWDCDQELGRFEGKTACPILSVIVYASSAGGPTLVLDQRPDDAWGETVRGGLVWPHAGAVAVFPGNLLNSVCGLPGEPTRFSGAAGSGAGQVAGVRETVLLNLWAACPLDLPHLPTELTPRLATPMPLALAGAVAATAPTPCSDGSSDDSRSRSRSPQAGPSLASSPAATTVSARCAQHTAAGAGAADATTASRVPDSRSHVAATTACSLLLGMFNRTESLTLSLPTIEYRGRCLEQFETVLNVAPMGPGGGPHGPATVHMPTAMAPDHKRKRCDALFDATADREPPFT